MALAFLQSGLDGGELTNVTKYLAIYGAVLSTITALWAVRRDLKDREKLRVRGAIATIDSFGKEIIADQITFEVVNAGRRQTSIQSVGGRYRNGDGFRLEIDHPPSGPIIFPLAIEPHDRKLIHSVLLQTDPREIRSLCAWDTLGRAHRIPQRDLRAILRLHLKRSGAAPTLRLRTVIGSYLPRWSRV